MNTRVLRVLFFSLGIAFLSVPLNAQSGKVRIIQTNAAGDNVHIIDPTTNEVVDVILGIPIPHGVTSHPDGSTLYFSNEVDHTLDIVPTATLKVSAQIPLTGRGVPTTSRSLRTAVRCTSPSRGVTRSSTSSTRVKSGA